jgi:Cu2+-exporting ATPase
MTGNMNRAASLLIIDYGTGIRVAAPTTILASMTKAARSGILIKGGRHIEQLAEVDALVFDKTGTLTTGAPQIADIIPYGKDVTSDEVLALAAAAEQRLNHPVAQAVVRAAEERGLFIPERATSDYQIGLGVEAAIDGMTVLVGNCRFLTNKCVKISRQAQRLLWHFERQSISPICVAVDDELKGLIGLSDPIRTESAAVIQALRDKKVRQIVMLTGDRPAVAKRVADALGIQNYIAEVFPKGKVEVVKDLQQEGYKVGVVGDGINDSPALAQADVGIAVNSGTDVAQETAHVVLLKGNLWKIPAAIDIARESTSLIRQNWQLIAIPNTAALGLSFIGVLGPVGATLISNGSTILAAANALRPIMNGSKRASAKPTRR